MTSIISCRGVTVSSLEVVQDANHFLFFVGYLVPSLCAKLEQLAAGCPWVIVPSITCALQWGNSWSLKVFHYSWWMYRVKWKWGLARPCDPVGTSHRQISSPHWACASSLRYCYGTWCNNHASAAAQIKASVCSSTDYPPPPLSQETGGWAN